ncbi:unnamed protein product [Symbiodinium sp. CCMP2592]|nr:unnamed protein product [Symbiodinium sp. CCMP2592]
MTIDVETAIVRVGGWLPWQGCFCFMRPERRVVLQGDLLLLCHLAQGEHPAVLQMRSLKNLGSVPEITDVDPCTVQRVVLLDDVKVLSEGAICTVVPKEGRALHLHFRTQQVARQWCQLLDKACQGITRQEEVLEQASALFSAPNQALPGESATPASGSHSPAKEEQPGKRGSSREDPSPRREQARLSDLAVLHVPFVQARRETKSLERTSAAQAEVSSKVRRPLSTEGAPASPSRSRASTPGGLNSLYGGGRRAAPGTLTVRPKERVSGGFWNTAGRLEALTAPLSPRARSRKMAFQQLLAGDDVLRRNLR